MITAVMAVMLFCRANRHTFKLVKYDATTYQTNFGSVYQFVLLESSTTVILKGVFASKFEKIRNPVLKKSFIIQHKQHCVFKKKQH